MWLTKESLPRRCERKSLECNGRASSRRMKRVTFSRHPRRVWLSRDGSRLRYTAEATTVSSGAYIWKKAKVALELLRQQQRQSHAELSGPSQQCSIAEPLPLRRTRMSSCRRITSQLEGEEMPVSEPGFLGRRTSIDLPRPEETWWRHGPTANLSPSFYERKRSIHQLDS